MDYIIKVKNIVNELEKSPKVRRLLWGCMGVATLYVISIMIQAMLHAPNLAMILEWIKSN